jgi:hypothetical protein
VGHHRSDDAQLEPHRTQAFGAFGVAISLTGLAPTADAIRTALADRTALHPVDRDPDVSYEIRVSDELSVLRHDEVEVAHVGYADTPTEAADLISDDIHQQIAHRTDGFLLIHAGSVAWRGLAVVIPGRSHSGKSTLVAALVRAGADYLSDEFAVLDRAGMVHPYARKLSVRRPDGSTRLIDVTELGGQIITESSPLALVVSTRFEPGARWDPTPLSGSRALLPLIDNSVVAQTRSAHTMSTIAGLGDRATTLVGLRGEADDIVDDILRRIERMADGILEPDTEP